MKRYSDYKLKCTKTGQHTVPTAKSLIFRMQCLNSLKEKFAGLSGAASLPESGNITSKASSADFASSHAGIFDPMAVITAEQTSAPTSA